MTGGAIRIGGVRGIPIRIHVSFLVVLPFLALGFGRMFGEATRIAGIPPERLHGSPFLWGLGIALALFLSVLVHELAHSLYALRAGGRVQAITLLMIGGVSQISEPPKTGRGEAVMAFVGPLASLVLGGLFYVVHRAMAGTALFDLRFAVFHLAYLNVVLGLFNLLPAFPMDGGRVLRGLLAERVGLLRATRTAAAAGKGFAVLFAIYAVVSANLVLMAVAFFVYLGAEAESRSVLVKALLGHIRVRDLLRSRPPLIDLSVSVYDVGERMLRERCVAFPVGDGGRVAGVVGLADVQRVPRGERGRVSVGDIARRIDPVDADDEASKALRVLAETRAPAVPVLESGVLVGLLSSGDVARALQLGELEATQHPAQPVRRAARPNLEQHA
ncbi:site-2 protease family protein [Anaeromyxobacter sp. Fw109-5]|uniref:site-2 protease family protein n=1 Tax=Anaeromyxobacter sp. (strain Fw109-5) TaxID=404589 RepID=UPI0000ED89CE|nr:site-2 protease family protein [Anaeromyxobacter sp. Fw109-5]ABS27330.1 peptidase M50 [Anaeromyxobacter sp. Fw109-5]